MTEEPEKERKIGNYILGKTIGEGTFGKVKLASHILTNQKVAIKILVKQKIIDVADVERVSRQIHILKLIRHPSIIQLYEIIETSRHLFLVMEYVQKGELFDFIVKETKLEEKQACRFFKNIISGIAYLHQLNIVHRDLKPENLLIDWNNGLKIVDFGLSNTYKTGELLKTACGSPCYAAPEMISNKKYNGLQVDIWSCGVILFAMVCGYLPFQDNNTSQLYKKILSGQYILPRFVTSQFKDILEKILSVDPNKRYRVQEIYNHAWCKQVTDIPLTSGIIVGYHRIPVDKEILNKLNEFNFDIDYAERCIEANKHNHITTTYYLLLKKHLKEGYSSLADLGSPTFDYSTVQPFKRPVDKKTNFLNQNNESPFIEIQNSDIRISKVIQTPLIKLKSQHTKFEDKKEILPENYRSNNFLERDKKIIGHLSDGKASRDLRMYLRPSSKKKMFYSEAKRRQGLRIHAQSLHHQPIQNQRQCENVVIRMNTEYQSASRLNSKSKYQRVKGNNRIMSRAFKEKGF